MKPYFLRMLFIFSSAFIGFFVLYQAVGDRNIAHIGLVSGVIIAFAAIFFVQRAKRTPLRIILGGAIGLTTGLIIANLVTFPLTYFIDGTYYQALAYLLTNSLFGYFGVSVGVKKGDELRDFNMQFIKFWQRSTQDATVGAVVNEAVPGNTILMDTSVIIDGRVLDICKTGFLIGKLVVPQFVLTELQNIADSAESIRRARGKRGLDILHSLQQDDAVGLTIITEDVAGVSGVDSKLVQLAKNLDASVLTNDWNLNKVAELQGVSVLNINALSSALKPVVLPGEYMNLLVAKKGKEAAQGVGYLDDGTMVVIDNAREHIGENVNVEVTSVLQTSGGRMIFSKVAEGDKSPVFLHASN
jgi:uncharacterized protein YacL